MKKEVILLFVAKPRIRSKAVARLTTGSSLAQSTRAAKPCDCISLGLTSERVQGPIRGIPIPIAGGHKGKSSNQSLRPRVAYRAIYVINVFQSRGSKQMGGTLGIKEVGWKAASPISRVRQLRGKADGQSIKRG